MGHIIRNRWERAPDAPIERAVVMRPEQVPEGVEVERARALGAASLPLDPGLAHVLSVIEGAAQLTADGVPLELAAGVHVFVPVGAAIGAVALAPGASVVRISSPSARGPRVLVRDEAFVAACAVEGQALRWVLTPQYLSRRIFLHHDAVLTSKHGRPLSWFHTTMFDVEGLPANADGESVFKMSYNSRTELNVCYRVEGDARVRMARHPYAAQEQAWDGWQRLDGDTTYHLDEEAVDAATGAPRRERNKHEVLARAGFVSLFCAFDPAPTGVERHRPGEYSDYEPLEVVAAREEYAVHQREIARLDAMVDTLSWARARGRLAEARGGEAWATYLAGRRAQRAVEDALIAGLEREGRGRERVVERWRSEDALPIER